ncbi:MAG: DedA family protein [Flavobacteriales bacterium]|nr:DedA family protein [Flavobacteriales bacterium]MCX7767978.1 DedA family protein [Flavobacteriales bacterium]MDW8409183.1 DedA family protein [Flavobacteriales bacterium]
MDTLTTVVDIFLHLDEHLAAVLERYGTLTYALLFVIVYVETGLVVMPLLPGDSLLFAAGALASSTGQLDVRLIIVLLMAAALLGDNTNYFIGRFFGRYIKARERVLFLKREYIEKTEAFYKKYGGRTVVMARFIPIVRTVAPFVAGAGSMEYKRYIIYCLTGALLWVGGITLLGFWFGNIPVVKNNFELVIISIILVSVLPMVVGFIKGRAGAARSGR